MPGVTQRVGVTRMVQLQDVPSKISYHPPLAWPGLTQRVTIIVTTVPSESSISLARQCRLPQLIGATSDHPMMHASMSPSAREKKNSIKPAFSTRPDNTSSPFPSTRAGYVTPFIEHSSS